MNNPSPDTRRAEMLGFIGRYPEADTSMVVDHMMEKFPGTKRHTHRAMLQRIDKDSKRLLNELMTDSMGRGNEPYKQTELNLEATQSGRTSSKQENVSASPKAAPAEPKPKKPKKEKRKSGSALPDGRSNPVRVPTEWPEIPRDMTKKRREFIRDMLVMNPEMKDRALLKEVKHAYPAVDEGATKAIVFQVRYALGKIKGPILAKDAKKKVDERLEKVAEAKCPVCTVKAWGEDEIQAEFGFRSKFQRRQSNCRSCRKTKLRST